MQVLSQKTRAFIYNSKGLHGFLVYPDIIKILKQIESHGQISSVIENHPVKISNLAEILGSLKKSEQKFSYLKKHYPNIFICVLKELKLFAKINTYMQACKKHEMGDPKDYSLYIYGYWVPWL